jgi:hypothetical protein
LCRKKESKKSYKRKEKKGNKKGHRILRGYARCRCHRVLPRAPHLPLSSFLFRGQHRAPLPQARRIPTPRYSAFALVSSNYL